MLADVDENPAERLARAVKARRLDLGLTHVQVHTGGGPSAPTLQKIEQARAPSMLDATVVALERALKWAPGSVRAIQEGGEPTPLGVLMEHRTDSAGHLVTVTVDVGEPLTEAEKRELIAAAEAEILRRKREMRNGRG